MSYDPARNSIGCHDLALRAWREWCIRTGTPPKHGAALIEPMTETERRWQAEGKVPVGQLETVNFGGHRKPRMPAGTEHTGPGRSQ